MEKITVLASVATIVSAIAIFVPSKGNTEGQTSHGSQSPNVQSSGSGGINIQYQNNFAQSPSSSASPTGYYLEYQRGGSTPLYGKPTINNPTFVCEAESGSAAELLEEIPQGELKMSWVKIRVVNGTCQGKVGWTAKANYRKTP